MLRDIIFKCAPFPWSSVVSGVSSLLGSGLGVVGGFMNNKTSKDIASMNNETMLKAMREQTKSEQDYNSISSQMQRAIAAGVNPILMAGAQPTSASSSSVPSLNQPVLQNPFSGFDFGGDFAVRTLLEEKQISNAEKSLDIQEYESKLEFLRIVGDLAKDDNITSDDINELLDKVLPKEDGSLSISALAKDRFVSTRLSNAIEVSNIDKDTKKYLYGWLDEMTNAQFTFLLADTEMRQTQSSVNRALSSLHEEKKKEITQIIKNLKEQWKSLNFQGELDASKLPHIARMSKALVNKLVDEARITKQEAMYWIWSQLNKSTNTFRRNTYNRISPLNYPIGEYDLFYMEPLI